MKQHLQQGIAALGLTLSDEQVEQLLAYVDLLQRWNKTYNLTAITDPVEMIDKHILDSLAIVPLLQGDDFLDVGTGGGLPGVVCAIACPHRQFTLIDSAGKKIRFLQQVKIQLTLANIHPLHTRIEAYQNAEGFDMILSRAFSSLDAMIEHTQHLCREQGAYLAMKGPRHAQELQASTIPHDAVTVHRLQVPGLPAERIAIIIAERGRIRD